jgi:hypothetical protein
MSFTFVMKKSIFLALIFLVACSAPEQTIQSADPTQSVFQTAIAQFPHRCPDDIPYYSDRTESFSPDGLWLGELCLNFKDQYFGLIFTNKKTGVIWKLPYDDYIPNVESADGGMRVAHWSNDSRYAYFHTSLGGSIGECFYEGYDTGVGLFRLDLQTGQTTQILPLNDNSVSYGFSFSPIDKWLVYGIETVDLVIFDITTGESINVAHKEEFSQGGGYVWSPDGLRFVFSSLKYRPDKIERESYTLRLVDAQTGVERILLESKTNCYLARKWQENNILLIEHYDENYNRALMEYDLNSDTIINASASPSP